jgi:hypothetical protein
MTARGGTHLPRIVYDIPSPGGPTHLKKCGEGTVTYLPWERNATLGHAGCIHARARATLA